MADKGRRKSSILKVRQRAPLQDVNTLNIKSKEETDEEGNAHTLLQQRRVSFAGKNFVKEFCSDTVSVWHGPGAEYEELLVSSDSSGLPSDYSNSNSNLALTNNDSTFHSNSGIAGLQNDDDNDPCVAIMRQFTGGVPIKATSQPPNAGRKTRYSFGEMQVESLEVSEERQISFNSGEHQVLSQTSSFRKTTAFSKPEDGQTTIIESQREVVSEIKSYRKTTTFSQPGDSQQKVLSESNSNKKAFEPPEDLQTINISQHQVMKYPEENLSLFPQSTTCGEVYNGIAEDNHVYMPSHNLVDNTNFDDSGMEFTKPIVGVIECGIPVTAVSSASCHTQTESPNILEDNENGSVGSVIQNNQFVDYDTKKQSSPLSQNLNNTMGVLEALPAAVQLESAQTQISCGIADKISHANQEQCVDASDNLTDIEDESLANQTNAMSTSMEFTKPVPGNILIHFVKSQNMSGCGSNHVDEMFSSETAAVCTSMEDTRPVPGIVVPDVDTYQGGSKDLSRNETQAMCTSMEFTKPVPGMIEVDVEAGQGGRRDLSRNETQAMCTSMEFTRPVPGMIEVDVEAGQGGRRDLSRNETQAMCTSMEFTRPVPGMIEVDVEAGQGGRRDLSRNETQMISTSMDFTRPVPGTIEVNVEECQGERRDLSRNETQMISTSMEFTRPLPGTIEVNMEECQGEGRDLSRNETAPMCTSMEFTRPTPGIVVTDVDAYEGGSKDLSRNETVAMCTSMDFTRPVPGMIEVDVEAGQDERRDLSRNETQVISTSMEFTRPVPGMIEFDVELCQYGSRDLSRNETQAMCTSMEFTRPVPGTIDVDVEACQGGRNYVSKTEMQSISTGIELEDCEVVYEQCNEQANHELSNKMQSFSTSKEFTGPEPGIIEVDAEVCLDGKQVMSRNATQSMCASINITRPVQTCMEVDFEECEVVGMFQRKEVNEKSTNKDLPLCTSRNIEAEIENVNKDEDFDNGEDKNEYINDEDLLIIPSSRSPSPERSLLMTFPRLIHTPPGARLLYSTIEAASKKVEKFLKTAESPVLPNSSQLHASKRSFDEMESGSQKQSAVSPTSLKKKKERETFDNQEPSIYAPTGESLLKEHIGSLLEEQSFPNEDAKSLKSDSSVSQLHFRSCSNHNLSAAQSTLASSDIPPNLMDCSVLSSEASSSLVEKGEKLCNLSDIIYDHQMKRKPQPWVATEKDDNVWSFKFTCTCLELRVHLRQSLLSNNQIESQNGHFTSHVLESTKPITRWGMGILMKKFQRNRWAAELTHSTNFMTFLEKITDVVKEVKQFMFEMILQEGMNGVDFSNDSLTFSVKSFKCHLWFKVKLSLLDCWESYLPEHISVQNIVGNVMEAEIKNLITGVKKDVYFLRHYIRDIQDYVKVLEGFSQ